MNKCYLEVKKLFTAISRQNIWVTAIWGRKKVRHSYLDNDKTGLLGLGLGLGLGLVLGLGLLLF